MAKKANKSVGVLCIKSDMVFSSPVFAREIIRAPRSGIRASGTFRLLPRARREEMPRTFLGTNATFLHLSNLMPKLRREEGSKGRNHKIRLIGYFPRQPPRTSALDRRLPVGSSAAFDARRRLLLKRLKIAPRLSIDAEFPVFSYYEHPPPLSPSVAAEFRPSKRFASTFYCMATRAKKRQREDAVDPESSAPLSPSMRDIKRRRVEEDAILPVGFPSPALPRLFLLSLIPCRFSML